MNLSALVIPLLALLPASEPKKVPAADISPEVQADIRSYVERDVAAGYLREREIITGIVELLSEDIPPSKLRPAVTKLTRASLEAHRKRQQSWPAKTDCDRLDAAFAALEQLGVVCRQNFSCCGTCGSGEIWDEIKNAEQAKKAVRGYAFFHTQDTESAVDGHGLYLNYGATKEGEAPALEIGRQIVSAFKTQGLEVVWDGTWDKRIKINLKWQKRR